MQINTWGCTQTDRQTDRMTDKPTWLYILRHGGGDNFDERERETAKLDFYVN